MGSTRRSFTEEYKAKAVTFVIDDHRSIAEVARNIGVHEMTLGKWVKKTRDTKEAATPPDAVLDESERLELVRLRAGHEEAQVTNTRSSDRQTCQLRVRSGVFTLLWTCWLSCHVSVTIFVSERRMLCRVDHGAHERAGHPRYSSAQNRSLALTRRATSRCV